MLGGVNVSISIRNSEAKPEHFFFTAEARLQRCRNYIRSRKGSLKNNVLEYHRWRRQPGPYLDCKLGWWAGLRSRLLARSLPPRCQAAQAWEKEVAIPRLCGNIYYWKLYNYMWYHNEKLFGSIQSGWDDIMASAVEQGRVPFHQGHRDSTEELARWLSLITTLLPGQSLPKSPHHICCHTMKSTESFYRQGKKLESLGSTCFCSISHFSVIGFRESLASLALYRIFRAFSEKKCNIIFQNKNVKKSILVA